MGVNFGPYKAVPLITVLFAATFLFGHLILWLQQLIFESEPDLLGQVLILGPTTCTGLLWGWYECKLWRLPFFSCLNTTPDIAGTYCGEIRFRFSGQSEQVKKCKLQIKQTCSRIKVECVFNREGEANTKSRSRVASILTDELGDHQLYFYYHNRGSCMSHDTLNAHDGMNVLDIVNENGSIRLEGYYFTNRDPQTKGCITVTRTSKRSS